MSMNTTCIILFDLFSIYLYLYVQICLENPLYLNLSYAYYVIVYALICVLLTSFGLFYIQSGIKICGSIKLQLETTYNNSLI